MSTESIDVRIRLSLLWVFVMLNMVFADILNFMGPGVLKQIMSGRAEQIVITPRLLLVFAVMTEIPIAMVVLSWALPHRAARWASIVAAIFTAAYVVGGGSAAPHYFFIAGMEVVGCAAIGWMAWKWRSADSRVRAASLAVE